MRRDVNGRWECGACCYHPGKLRDADFEDVGQHAPETAEELRTRHDAQVAAGTEPGVIRHTRDVGPGERVIAVDPKDVELEALRAEVARLGGHV
jgi:hypothetical protein